MLHITPPLWLTLCLCVLCAPAGLIVSRAVRTIDRSQDLGLRMLKQPPHKQMDYYYSRLLGKDWQQQLEQVSRGTFAESLTGREAERHITVAGSWSTRAA